MFKNRTRKYKVNTYNNTKQDTNLKKQLYSVNDTKNLSWSQKTPIQTYTPEAYTETLQKSEWNTSGDIQTLYDEKNGIYRIYNNRPLRSIARFNTRKIACLDKLELLHQYTGQCWNDSSIVFMWFASGAGEHVQNTLLHKYTKDMITTLSVEDMFRLWIEKEEVQTQIRDLFPLVSNNNLQMAAKALTDYVGAMQERFILLGKYKTKNINTPERTMSQACSITGEETGIRAAKSLLNSEFSSNTRYSIRKGLQTYLNTGIQDENLKERVLSDTKKGFSSTSFANVIYLLLQYFLNGNLVLYVKDYTSVIKSKRIASSGFTSRDLRGFAEENVETKDSIEILKKIVEEQKSPVFIYNPFATKNGGSEYSTRTMSYIIEAFPRYHISANVSIVQKDYDGVSGHAISFITCENGEQYFYDDNTYKLESLPWYLLFKGVTEDNEMDIVYIPYVGLSAGYTFLDINLSLYKPHTDTNRSMFIQVIFPKMRTKSNIADIQFLFIYKGRLAKLPVKNEYVKNLLNDRWIDDPMHVQIHKLLEYNKELYYMFRFPSILIHNPNIKADISGSRDKFRVLVEDTDIYFAKYPRQISIENVTQPGGSRKRKQTQKRKTRKY